MLSLIEHSTWKGQTSFAPAICCVYGLWLIIIVSTIITTHIVFGSLKPINEMWMRRICWPNIKLYKNWNQSMTNFMNMKHYDGGVAPISIRLQSSFLDSKSNECSHFQSKNNLNQDNKLCSTPYNLIYDFFWKIKS